MRFRYQVQDEMYEVAIERGKSGLLATVNGVAYPVEVLDEAPGEISLRFDGVPLRLYWASDGDLRWVSLHGCTYTLEKPQPRGARSSADARGEAIIRAPMPAQVRAVQVAAGERVDAGQTLLLLEAMKMEIRLQAPAAGRVTQIHASPDQSVEKDEILIELDFGDEPGGV